MSLRSTIAALVLMFAVGHQVEARQVDTLSGGLQSLYKSIRANLLEAAELMPAELYGFKPTPDVRSFGELVGHVTNTQYNFCSPVRPDVKPEAGDHEKLKTKAELVQALKNALAYCDPAYATATDASLSAPAKFGGMPIAGGYALTYNVAHDNEHYGNMVTYLRLKGLVPPSTARNKKDGE